MDAEFWSPIKDIEVWDQPRLAYASQSTYKMIGSLKIRLWDCFKQFPYPLLAYESLPPARQDAVAAALFRCNREHYEPGITQQCHDLHPLAAAFKANHLLHSDLTKVGQAVPNNNIASEDKFARQNCYNQSNRGNLPNHENIAHRRARIRTRSEQIKRPLHRTTTIHNLSTNGISGQMKLVN
jgi:hypothetical protein